MTSIPAAVQASDMAILYPMLSRVLSCVLELATTSSLSRGALKAIPTLNSSGVLISLVLNTSRLCRNVGIVLSPDLAIAALISAAPVWKYKAH